MASSVNRVVGTGFIVLGLGLIGFGVFVGAFGWMNDGAAAGLGLFLVPVGFGLAAIAIGVSFHVVARAHASASRWRWWLQPLLPLVTFFLAFGLAAEFSVLVDRLTRR